MDGGVTDGPRLRQRIEVHTIGGIDSGEATTLHLYYKLHVLSCSHLQTKNARRLESSKKEYPRTPLTSIESHPFSKNKFMMLSARTTVYPFFLSFFCGPPKP